MVVFLRRDGSGVIGEVNFKDNSSLCFKFIYLFTLEREREEREFQAGSTLTAWSQMWGSNS